VAYSYKTSKICYILIFSLWSFLLVQLYALLVRKCYEDTQKQVVTFLVVNLHQETPSKISKSAIGYSVVFCDFKNIQIK